MKEQFETYFDEKIAACQAAVTSLNADNRTDEAVFEKIRMNVYGIFRSICQTSAKINENDTAKTCDFLLFQLEKIPSTWKSAYENAEKHGDTGRMHIEQLKLETAEEIRRTVLNWREHA